MRRFAFLSVLSIGLGLPFSGYAEVYRCTGAAGEPLFSQVRCGDTATIVVRSQPSQEPAQGLRAGEKAWLAQRAEKRRSHAAKSGAGTRSKRRSSQKTVEANAHRCLRTRRDLDMVNAKLRRGYKPSQGESLRGRRQRYEDYLSSFCD